MITPPFIRPLTRIIALSGLIAAMAALSPTLAAPPTSSDTPVVIELFTSQGCSSCPPADAVIAELAQQDDLLPLSFFVDYWDYIGWKDIFAIPANSQRQRAYARQKGSRRVYTPQIVIQGDQESVGSDQTKIKRYIKAARQNIADSHIPISLDQNGNILNIRVAAAPDSQSAILTLITYRQRQQVAIGAGENRGRTINYTNIVRDLQPLGSWHGEALQLSLPVDDFTKGVDGVAVLLQRRNHGPIIGAARLALHADS